MTLAEQIRMLANADAKSLSTPRTVLVVEDERVSRHALVALLRHSGYVTDEVASAEEAIRLFKRAAPPEFAIIDVDLPGMNGVDLADYLARHNPSVHSVLVTATDLDRLHALLVDHDVPFLRKPLDFKQLLHVLKENSYDKVSR
jgi:CheY-like chemotaxis protein